MKRTTEEYNFDIHNKKGVLESAKRKLASSKICKGNKRLIEEYILEKTVDDNIGVARQEKLYAVLLNVAEIAKKPFPEMSENEIVNCWRKIKTSNVKRWRKVIKRGKTIQVLVDVGKQISPWTQTTYGIVYKGFLRWLKKRRYTKIDILEVLEDIKTPKKSDLIVKPRGRI